MALWIVPSFSCMKVEVVGCNWLYWIVVGCIFEDHSKCVAYIACNWHFYLHYFCAHILHVELNVKSEM